MATIEATRPAAADGISIVIPHYGDPRLAAGLVEQVLADPPPGPLQIIVVDDGSPTSFPLDPRVLVVRLPANSGFGTAVNAGVASAELPWLLVANSDVRLAPGVLAEFLRAAAPLQPAVCGVRQWNPGRARFDPAARPMIGLSTVVLARSRAFHAARRLPRLRTIAGLASPEGETTGEVDWLTGSLLLLPTALFRDAGGFDPRFRMYCEEADLQRRLRAQGIPAVLLSRLHVDHEAGSSSMGFDREVQLLRSQLDFILKWDGPGRRLFAEVALLASIVGDVPYEAALRVAGRGDSQPLRDAQRRLQQLRRACRTAARPGRWRAHR